MNIKDRVEALEKENQTLKDQLSQLDQQLKILIDQMNLIMQGE